MRRLAFIGLLLTSMLPSAHAVAACTESRAIWSTEHDGIRHVVYGTEGVDYFSSLYFEEWRGSKLAWRATGQVTCSNGAVTCYAEVDARTDDLDPPANTSAVVEKIDQDNDGISDWVIFAGLGQSLYYSGGASVKWFNGFGPDDFDRVVIPNIFRFQDCRASETIVLNDPPATPIETIVGQLYGTAAICERYALQGQLFMEGLDTVANDGLWWMDDVRLVGHEFECKIRSRTNNEVNLQCAGEGEIWTESRSIADSPEGRRVGEVALAKCE